MASTTFSGDDTLLRLPRRRHFPSLLLSGSGIWDGKERCRVASIGVMRPELVMKSIVPYWGNPKAKSYYLLDGYESLVCGLVGLSARMAIKIVVYERPSSLLAAASPLSSSD
ncbi:V-type proton ATPase subunit c4-like [Argentina anserina]|uniref:V-type proton ATPase subunit c4-like n=1 Tax=Argentina anserina TaxID=57926 RepID=UPI0021762E0B|nr:V-type proton ATPase subunit c4-like [Potentilla anserina]